MAVEGLHLRGDACTNGGNDIVFAVAIHIAHCNSDLSITARKGKEVVEKPQIGSVECFDIGRSALPCAGDDLRHAIAVQIAGGHIYAAGEGGVIREKAIEQVQILPIEHFHLRVRRQCRAR